MDNARLEQLLPLILPHVNGCPDITAMMQARLACIEFCERTRCWRHMVTVDVAPGSETALACPVHCAIYEIEAATIEGGPCLIPTQHTLVHHHQSGPPQYITQTGPNGISVFPIDQAYTLRLSVFLKPRVDHHFGTDPDNPLFNAYDVVPSWMISQYGHMLVDGALARLLALPKEPWTDENRAAFYGARFDQACNTKFHQNIRGQQRARARVRYQDF